MGARRLLGALLAVALAARAQEVDEDNFGGLSFEQRDAAFKPTQTFLCQCCNVAVTELWRANPKLREDVGALSTPKRRERMTDIYEVMDGIFCAEGAAIRYALDPYTYGRGCKLFLERYNEDFDVEKRLIAGVPGSHFHDLASSVCRDVCEGVPGVDRVPPDAKREPQDCECLSRSATPCAAFAGCAACGARGIAGCAACGACTRMLLTKSHCHAARTIPRAQSTASATKTLSPLASTSFRGGRPVCTSRRLPAPPPRRPRSRLRRGARARARTPRRSRAAPRR
jgi:hypothetical protein